MRRQWECRSMKGRRIKKCKIEIGCGVVQEENEREMGRLGVNIDEGGGKKEEKEKEKENSLKTT